MFGRKKCDHLWNPIHYVAFSSFTDILYQCDNCNEVKKKVVHIGWLDFVTIREFMSNIRGRKP